MPGPTRCSEVGLGCVTFGREIDADKAWRVLDRAVEAGLRLLDTAEQYGTSEAIIGAWLRARGGRDALTIATKLAPPLTPARIRAGVARSRDRLGVACIDLYQLHGWDNTTPLAETLYALAEAKRAGLIRHYGLSNFTARQLDATQAVVERDGLPPPWSLQPRYNLASREIEADVLPLCVQRGLRVLAYSPLGAGFLTGKYRPGAPAPAGSRFDVAPGHRDLYFSPAAFAAVEILHEVAERHGVPPAEVALAWVMRQPAVDWTLIGARSPEHVDQAIRSRTRCGDDALWDDLSARLGHPRCEPAA
jgi:1-deoxyxylulose-5-phosphate synthase